MRRIKVAKRKVFDWYTFLVKKVLRGDIFNTKKVSLSFWADGPATQGSRFHVYALCGNWLDCPVTVDMKLKVTPKTFLRTKKQASRLIVPRRWRIPLGPGEMVLASARGYACSDCKPCTVTFEKAKVSKEGKGKCVLKRKGKSLGANFSPWGLLLLPLGFFVISWRYGGSLELPIKKDKAKTEDEPENLQEQSVSLHSIWSLAEPQRLDLTPVTAIFEEEDRAESEAVIERLCREAYSRWCRRCRQDDELEIVTSGVRPAEPSESEQTEAVSTIPVNVNWQE
jgi:hypothetical protein